MAENKINFTINEGDTFFADEIAVMHSPVKVILDFKSITPRFDVRNRDMQPMVLKHNVVIMDPYIAKDMFNALKRVISRFEKDFGTIKTPKGLSPEKSKKKMVDTPNYFG